jgi:hypothetical protein
LKARDEEKRMERGRESSKFSVFENERKKGMN